jgi:hypothetical protein
MGKPQFSLIGLLRATMAMAIVLGILRWAGSIWFVPILLAAASSACLAMALRTRRPWRTLKVGYWHLTIWLGLATAATGLSVKGCQDYNKVAGTDKTPGHITWISAATLAGPLVGPVANPGAGEARMARTWTLILAAVLLLSLSPFLLVRRVAHAAIAVASWTGFVAASVLWFFGAMISLGVFLS